MSTRASQTVVAWIHDAIANGQTIVSVMAAALKNVAARRLLLLAGYIILAAGLAFQILITLSGAIHNSFLDSIYFLQADTSRIPNAPTVSRWTYFAICSVSENMSVSCGNAAPAVAFDPPDNFGTAQRVPAALINNTSNRFLSKAMFAFLLVATFFSTILFFAGLSTTIRYESTKLHRITSFAVWFFQAGGCIFMTAWAVQGRDAFVQAGSPANIGLAGFGFTWGALACHVLFLAFIVLADSVSKDKPPPMTRDRRDRMLEEESGLVRPGGEKAGHF